MLDARLRSRLVAPVADRMARPLAARHVPALALTLAGFALGIGSCVAAGFGSWWYALALWLVSRAFDGLDGALARATGPTDLGGYLDLGCDLTVYGGFVIGVAVAVPSARLACVVLLAAYYVNAGAWLSYSALAERKRLSGADERSLRFVAGLAEGTETIVVYVLFCLLPNEARVIAWGFAALVALSAAQRVLLAVRTL